LGFFELRVECCALVVEVWPSEEQKTLHRTCKPGQQDKEAVISRTVLYVSIKQTTYKISNLYGQKAKKNSFLCCEDEGGEGKSKQKEMNVEAVPVVESELR
jgi:hypothetical protein